jgi:hypothetical protein
LYFLQLCRINARKSAHHFQQIQRRESRVFAADYPTNRRERKHPMEFNNVHVIACLGSSGEREGLVCRDVEQMQTPATSSASSWKMSKSFEKRAESAAAFNTMPPAK